MKRFLLILSIVLGIAGFSPAYGQGDDGLELSSLIINKTLTRFGNEFYTSFSNHWAAPENFLSGNIRIQEAPSARWGSLIIVWVGDEIMFRTSLSTRTKNIDEIAKQATDGVLQTMFARTILQQSDAKGDQAGDGL